jgi:hypothetical protein
MGKTSTHRYERVASDAMKQCPNCDEYKLATLERWTYHSFWRSLLDFHNMRLSSWYGEWTKHRKMCDWCGYRENL